MLREEDHIHADKEEPEMRGRQKLIIHDPEHFTEPVIKARKYPEYSAHRQNIVEMGHNVIGVMEIGINTRTCEHNTRYATNNKEEDKGQSPLHGYRKSNRAAPHGGKP